MIGLIDLHQTFTNSIRFIIHLKKISQKFQLKEFHDKAMGTQFSIRWCMSLALNWIKEKRISFFYFSNYVWSFSLLEWEDLFFKGFFVYAKKIFEYTLLETGSDNKCIQSLKVDYNIYIYKERNQEYFILCWNKDRIN